jgi:Zn-dependent membrane protease YugP
MGYLQGKEIEQAKAVLNAAAWTYVAAATMALSQLIRLLILRSSRD